MNGKLQIKFPAAAAIVLLAVVGFAGQVFGQSGGDLTIRQSVVSAGGAASDAGNTFAVIGTIAQTAVGRSSNKSFNAYGGFLTPRPTSLPTGAAVTVGGRITTADGRGIRSVFVSMTNTAGETRTALSTTFGYYRFTDVPAGETYIFTVFAKRFQFGQTMQIHFVQQDTVYINFIAVN